LETLKAIHNRRSIRDFTDQPLPEELLRQVLQAAISSASGGNVQAWAFLVIQEPSHVRAVRSLAPGIIGQPRTIVAIGLDVQRAERAGGALGLELAWIDIGLAMQNLLLAAYDLGLGACPIGSFHKKAVALFLDLPPHIRPVLLIALGYPKSEPPSRGRRPLAEVCFAERWGNPL